MEIHKLKTVYDKILSDIETSPESSYNNFEPVWKNLSIEEKSVLRQFIIRYFNATLGANNISLDKQFHLAHIATYVELDYNGNTAIPSLRLTENIKDVQIAKLFYDLKKAGYIDNTSEEIASSISNLFSLNFDTIFSYLSNPLRFEKALPLFKE
jgi:hypothetical protein